MEPAGEHRVVGGDRKTTGRTIWLLGMGLWSLPLLAGIVFGVVAVAEDLSTSGEMFDGLGIVIGVLVGGICLLVLAGAVGLVLLSGSKPVAAAVLSALLPGLAGIAAIRGLFDRVGNPDYVTGLPVLFAIAVASLGWAGFCAFVKRWSPESVGQTA